MVRSNPNKQIGFLSNEKRMNVAVTRAKRLCVLIGDSSTVSKNEFLRTLVDYFKEFGVGRSAFDYNGDQNVRIGYGVRKNAQNNATTATNQASAKDIQMTSNRSETGQMNNVAESDKS